MKILITAAAFSSSISGVQRHALNVVRCLLRCQEVSNVHLAIAPWQRDLIQAYGLDLDSRLTVHVAEMKQSSISRNLWYYRGLPALAARLRVDLVHLSYPVPVDTALLRCPVVVTLHDLYPYEIPHNFGFSQVIFNRLILRECLRNADVIACVSANTNTRLKQYVPPHVWRKAVQIYNCVEAEPLCAIQSPIPGWSGEPFLLCVAQHRRNKNIPLLIRTFHHLLRQGQVRQDMKLVVIGIAGPETRLIRKLVSQYGLNQAVKFLEGLPEPELQWCYARCETLIVPSQTEGFGLPVAEALLAGCRVVCSDIPAFREVGGEHCRFVTLGRDGEKAFGAAIVAAIREPAKAPVTLPQFSAEVLARQYLGVYQKLLASVASTENAQFFPSIQTAASERQPL